MEPFILPVSDSLHQVLTLSVPLSSGPRLFQFSLRCHLAPNLWFFSIRDGVTGEDLLNHIPVRASFGAINDLLKPFRHLALGSLCCFPKENTPDPTDPGSENLAGFDLIWSDSFD